MSKRKENTLISHNIKHSATAWSKRSAAKNTSAELYCVRGYGIKPAFSKCSTNLQESNFQDVIDHLQNHSVIILLLSIHWNFWIWDVHQTMH